MTLKKVLILLATASAIALAAGCDSDSDNGGGGGDNGGDNGGGDNGGGGGPDGSSYQEDFSNTDRYNVVTDNSLTFDNSSLAVTPSSATPNSDYDTVKNAAGDDVDLGSYFGAVDPDASETWWDGWTIRHPDIDGNLPGTPETFHPLQAEIGDEITGASDCSNIGGTGLNLTQAESTLVFSTSFPVCVIKDGDLDGNYTLTNDRVYVLDGTVQVGNGDVEGAHDDSTVRNDVLTIEAGTQIMGESGSDPSLVITRGSKIEANGTAEMPIIFGAVDANRDASEEITGVDDNEFEKLGDRGAWGSLVIAGYGKVNNGDTNNQTTTEAVPDGVTRWFGGTDNTDDSGTVEYVVLAETGEPFRPDEEVQGLTIEGSGSETTISHVQVTNSDDDGIEWFGGAVSADHLVIQGVTDDSLDMDLGYQGVIQHALVIQGANHGDRGIESDNNGDDFGATPKTSPVIANLTILGNSGNEGTTKGALHREGFGGQVYRAVYSDQAAVNVFSDGGQFGLGCLDVDDELDEDLKYGDVIFNCSAGGLEDDND